MRILFAGPWDLAGKAAAEYFLREGHEVCWLTAEPRRTLWDRKLQGTVCRGQFTAAQIVPILRTHRIETVIVLTAGLREGPDACPDPQAGPLGELLAAVQSCPVGCFVYLSSLELAWQSPLTPRQAALAAGELRCRAARDHDGLPLLLVRLAWLYDRVPPEDMGTLGAALQAVRRGEVFHSPCGPEDRVDALAAGDAAAALYRMVLHTMTGSYLLGTGHPLTMRDCIRCVERAAGRPARVQWTADHPTMAAAQYSAEPLKTATGWMPYTLLAENGWQLLRDAPDARPQAAPDPKHPRRGKVPPGLRSLGETLVLFGITVGLLRFSKDMSDLKYVDIRLMFVALVASCYGSGMGLVAVALASLSYVYSLASSYVDVSYLLYSVDTWVPFVIYAVTGSLLGYLTGRRRDEMEALRRKARQQEEKCEQLQAVQGETLEIKSRLQQRITAERHSFADLYRIVQELDALDPPQILQHTVGIVEDLLQCGHVAVYRMEPDGCSAALAACSPAMQGRAPRVPDGKKLAALCREFGNTPVFANTDLTPGRPDLAAAIRFDRRLYGIVAAYELGPDRFTTYYRDLLKVVVGLIERDLVRALEVPRSERVYAREVAL